MIRARNGASFGTATRARVIVWGALLAAALSPAVAASSPPPVPLPEIRASKGAAEEMPGSSGRRSWVALGMNPNLRVTLEKGRDLYLLVLASPHDSYETFASRFLDKERPSSSLAAANPGRATIRPGSWYRIPVTWLTPGWWEKALRAVFPKDGPSEAGWIHRPSASPLDTYGEGAWQAALWFTGDGRNFEAILRTSGLRDPVLPAEREVTIPADRLLGPFRSAWQAWRRTRVPDVIARTQEEGLSSSESPERSDDSDEPADEPPGEVGEREDEEPRTDAERPSSSLSTAGPAELTFLKDAEGDYATYRLKRGEALYSSVVVRFTGRIDPEDVAEAAAIIAERSGIRDVTGIPVGHAIRIPRALLLPEFLPPEDSRRQAVEAIRHEAEKVHNPVRSRHLQGIHVILDAGHGGVDPGALIGGVAEHEYVYDVMCRVKHLLETETSAVVHPIIEDPAGGFAPRSARVLPVSGGEKILTTPAHFNDVPGETSLGVQLRWYLANSIERRLLRSGVDPSRIVFVSFHADVLHPSLRGAMVYVPGERYRRGSYACAWPECSRYGEVRESPTVRFSKSDRVRSEGLSRELASDLIHSFVRRGILVHPYLPVRDRIIRKGRAWLPAVLRGNGVPVKLLVEMANLNNAADRTLMKDPSFRESFARAFMDALLVYYKSGPSGPAPRATVARRQKRR
jgi:N-acetylmuramoyl-L-alanine amidase